ncbi:hypothetical protein VTJ04DRAFT_7215 [Mycothermus thermophilus]|uniref:uncharacterized protein n=1 Tax=Humicola insolens TaxID=85995 RepID=UPI00374373E6
MDLVQVEFGAFSRAWDMFDADAAAARADFDLTHMGGRKSGTVVACLSPSVPRRSLRCIHFHATNEAPPALHFTVGPPNHGSESRESSGLGLVQGATFGSLAKPRLVLPQIFLNPQSLAPPHSRHQLPWLLLGHATRQRPATPVWRPWLLGWAVAAR